MQGELRFEDVVVEFGTGSRRMTALGGVSLVVPAGQVVGLVGESGSGKSTLARAALGLVPLKRGTITVDGTRVTARRQSHQSRIQMIFQDPYSSLDPRMTIGRSIAEALPRGKREGRRALVSEVETLLGMVGLDTGRSAAYPADLSGGQRQRVGIARALAARPTILVADEVTSALDVSVQASVLNLMRSLHRELGLSMLFISHDLAVVRYVSDYIAVMYLGRIVEFGPADDVLRDPQHPYTRELLSALEFGTPAEPLDERTAHLISAAEPADPRHPPSGCHFHPRCPIGPLVDSSRVDCLTLVPSGENRRHQAACHYVDPVPLAISKSTAPAIPHPLTREVSQ